MLPPISLAGPRRAQQAHGRMTALTTSLDPRSAAFAANAAAMRALVADLRKTTAAIDEGGGETARRRHLGRGKLLPRERVRALLDPGSPFLELSPLAAYGMYDGEVPAAGIITGIGRDHGARMRRRRQRRDRQGRHLLPDDRQEASAGAGDRAREPAALPLPGRFRRGVSAGAGRGLSRTATISAGSSTIRRTCRRLGVPQIALVMGSCTAGGAYVPAMSDESRHRAGPGNDLSRRAAAGARRDRRGRQRRGAGRRRCAQPDLRRHRSLRAR